MVEDCFQGKLTVPAYNHSGMAIEVQSTEPRMHKKFGIQCKNLCKIIPLKHIKQDVWVRSNPASRCIVSNTAKSIRFPCHLDRFPARWRCSLPVLSPLAEIVKICTLLRNVSDYSASCFRHEPSLFGVFGKLRLLCFSSYRLHKKNKRYYHSTQVNSTVLLTGIRSLPDRFLADSPNQCTVVESANPASKDKRES